MADERTYHTRVRLARDYEFVAEFPDLPTTPAPLVLDEPAPLGSDRGPNAAALIGAAIATVWRQASRSAFTSRA
jgi:hypothetical protein